MLSGEALTSMVDHGETISGLWRGPRGHPGDKHGSLGNPAMGVEMFEHH